MKHKVFIAGLLVLSHLGLALPLTNNHTLVLNDYTCQRWDGAQWKNRDRTVYIYEVKGNLTEESTQNWINGQWVNQRTYTYTYDEIKRRKQCIYEEYFRVTGEYDTMGNFTEIVVESWDNGQWGNFQKYIYTYSRLNEGTPISEKKKDNNHLNTVNITTNGIRIPGEGSMLTVYDLQGCVVARITGTRQVKSTFIPLHMRNIPPGIYVFRFTYQSGCMITLPVTGLELQ